MKKDSKTNYPHLSQMLEAGGNSAEGAIIIVFTDGAENSKPYIRDVRNEVLNKGAVVHGLLLDDVASKHELITLSVDSGGDFCIFADAGLGGIDYYMCMMRIIAGLGNFAALEVRN